jgi:hypothetical protein
VPSLTVFNTKYTKKTVSLAVMRELSLVALGALVLKNFEKKPGRP